MHDELSGTAHRSPAVAPSSTDVEVDRGVHPVGVEDTLAPFELRPAGHDGPRPEPTTEPSRIEPRPPRRAAIIAASAARFAAVFWSMTVLWFAVFSVLPTLVGWSPTVVTSDSMAPTVGAGTVVHVDPGVDLQILGPGSIVTFDDPKVPGRLVTHRVVEVVRDSPDGSTVGFRTKGDANVDSDSAIVPLDAVHGATRLVVPYAGLPRVWLDEGRWWMVGLVVVGTAIAAAVAADTLGAYASGRSILRSARRRRLAAIALAVVAMLGGGSTSAAFSDSTGSSNSEFTMTSDWYLRSIDADAPVAHWRLDDSATGATTTVLDTDFESPTTFTRWGSGEVALSTARARSGLSSAHKTGNNDPNGGWTALPAGVAGSFTLDVWVHRPSSASGGSVDRIGLENPSFGGYSVYASHGANLLRIDRRDGGAASSIGSSVAFDPPEDEWYRLRLRRAGSSLTVSAHDETGTMLASTAATDSTYTSFDRLVVRGGHDYFVDDVTVTQDPSPAGAIDRIGTEDGIPLGSPTPQQPSLLDELPAGAASFAFDGSNGVLIGDDPAINTSTRAERTVELWFEADALGGRQMLYEEGGTVNGLNVYLDGDRLIARAWGQSTGWSNPLEVATVAGAIAVGERHHVGVVLDAVTTRSLELHVDGALVGTSTKTDAGAWNAHSDDGAIARVNGSTQYHDGNSSGPHGFVGRIDEVVLFNSALGADRIDAHWSAGR